MTLSWKLLEMNEYPLVKPDQENPQGRDGKDREGVVFGSKPTQAKPTWCFPGKHGGQDRILFCDGMCKAWLWGERRKDWLPKGASLG